MTSPIQVTPRQLKRLRKNMEQPARKPQTFGNWQSAAMTDIQLLVEKHCGPITKENHAKYIELSLGIVAALVKFKGAKKGIK